MKMPETKPKLRLIDCERLNRKRSSEVRQTLRKKVTEAIHGLDKNVQGYVLIAWNNNGNKHQTSYWIEGMPARSCPEYIRSLLENAINDKTS